MLRSPCLYVLTAGAIVLCRHPEHSEFCLSAGSWVWRGAGGSQEILPALPHLPAALQHVSWAVPKIILYRACWHDISNLLSCAQIPGSTVCRPSMTIDGRRQRFCQQVGCVKDNLLHVQVPCVRPIPFPSPVLHLDDAWWPTSFPHHPTCSVAGSTSWRNSRVQSAPASASSSATTSVGARVRWLHLFSAILFRV